MESIIITEITIKVFLESIIVRRRRRRSRYIAGALACTLGENPSAEPVMLSLIIIAKPHFNSIILFNYIIPICRASNAPFNHHRSSIQLYYSIILYPSAEPVILRLIIIAKPLFNSIISSAGENLPPAIP